MLYWFSQLDIVRFSYNVKLPIHYWVTSFSFWKQNTSLLQLISFHVLIRVWSFNCCECVLSTQGFHMHTKTKQIWEVYVVKVIISAIHDSRLFCVCVCSSFSSCRSKGMKCPIILCTHARTCTHTHTSQIIMKLMSLNYKKDLSCHLVSVTGVQARKQHFL